MTKEVGTYRWMAPEALGAFSATSPVAPVTQKSDIYSYAIVLWELVTGGVPYTNYSPLQAAVGVALNNLRPPIPADCDPALRSLMIRAWDKNPWTRPEAAQIVEELDARILSRTLDQSRVSAERVPRTKS
jgi:serine/threonine protein kinase